MSYTVKAVSQLAGISIRTLHHYDQIGLLKPSQVSAAGYRLYAQQDLQRLQHILFFRELGFNLQEIKAIVTAPSFDQKRALQEHRQLLLKRQERLGQLVSVIDRTLDALERGIVMDEKAMFNGFDPSRYEEEARQRWGGTKEYQESVQRAKRYTKGDWAAINQDSAAINSALAAMMDRDPADPDVQEQVRQWHQLIEDRFYTCSTEVFRGLGDMYAADPRFAGFYDKIKPGLAHFLRDAITVYCDRLEGK